MIIGSLRVSRRLFSLPSGRLFGCSLFGSHLLLWLARIGRHIAALMRPALIVALHVAVENGLHFVDGLESGRPASRTRDYEALVLVIQAFYF